MFDLVWMFMAVYRQIQDFVDERWSNNQFRELQKMSRKMDAPFPIAMTAPSGHAAKDEMAMHFQSCWQMGDEWW